MHVTYNVLLSIRNIFNIFSLLMVYFFDLLNDLNLCNAFIIWLAVLLTLAILNK